MDNQWTESALRRGLAPFLKLWLPRAVICVFIYFLLVRLINGLITALAFITTKAGSSDFSVALHRHPFARALVVGVIAGLVPMRFWLAVSGVFNSNIENYLRNLKTESMKPWIWAFFSPVFVLDLLGWVGIWFEMNGRSTTVLQITSSYRLSDLVSGYFSTDCSGAGYWPLESWEMKTSFRCIFHVQMLSLVFLSVGYSIAPLLSRKFLAIVAEQPPQTDHIEEPAIEGNIEQQ